MASNRKTIGKTSGELGNPGESEEQSTQQQIEDALQKSEERYRTLAESAHDAIFIIDREDIVEYANSFAARFLRCRPEEIIGKKRDELFPPDISAKQQNSLQTVFNTGEPVYTDSIVTQLGNKIWLSNKLVPLYNTDGEVRAVLGISRDITGRKVVEEALKESESRYRSLFEDSPISLWEEDCSDIAKYVDNLRRDGIEDFSKYFDDHTEDVIRCAGLMKIVDVNNASLSMFKSSTKEGLLKSLYNVFTEKSFIIFKEQLIAVSQGKTTNESEASLKTLTGKEFPVNLKWSVAPGHEETYSKVLVSIIDISQRKQIEENLRDSEARYRSLFEDSPISLWEEDCSRTKEYIDKLKKKGITDFRTYFKNNFEEVYYCAALMKVTDVNKASLSMFGTKSREELINFHDKFFSESSYVGLMEEFIAIAEGKTILEKEGFAKTLTGDEINIHLKWHVAPGHEETYSKVLMSIIDITETKKAEAAIAIYTKELEESNKLKELFTDIMSHDLLNPLNIASNYIEILQENETSLEKIKYLETAKRNLDKALELIDDSTKLSKFESLEHIDYEDLDLKQVIWKVVKNLEPLAARSGMEIENNLTHSMPVRANRIIEEIFSNFISNAIKYASDGKKIVIEGSIHEDNCVIKVKDFGGGIRDVDKTGIFERFLTLEKQGVKGSGLGLEIARKIAQLHNGRIWVEDNPKGGAVFILEIPK